MTDDFIFIHINKCAGTSIKKSLDYTRHKDCEYKHEKIGDIARRMTPYDFKHTFKAGFVRHPYTRIRSMYFYRKYQLNRAHIQELDFEQWFWRAFTDESFTAVQLMNAPCSDYLEIDGEIAVDFIGFYERLEEDFAKLCDILGASAKLERHNSYVKPPEDVSYTKAMRRLLKSKFAKDFNLYESRSILQPTYSSR